MSVVTLVWSMIASACLTLSVIYALVWWRDRRAWAHLFFSLTAAATTVFTFSELAIMRAESPRELLTAMQWVQLTLSFWLVSISWFVWFYLDAGRRWLAWTITGMRLGCVLLNLLMWLDYPLPRLRQIRFLGESVTVLGGGLPPHPVAVLFGQASILLILVFVADASLTTWRRGDRRKALMVGSSVEFFLVASLGLSVLVLWAHLQVPIVYSLLYMGLISIMGYELSGDVLRASQLVRELRASEAGLRESEARMSLAVDAADFGIWVRDLTGNQIWASEKWRELFGFAQSDTLHFDAILLRLHSEDRKALRRAHAMAVANVDGGRYQTEFRLVLPDGAIRWISSCGRVECDSAGRPLLIRGASRDITASKHTELAIRSLSGRLLSAQEEERRRIARELHDNLSQHVALLAIEIQRLAMTSEPQTAVAASTRKMGARIDEIAAEIHSLSHQLHSAKLEALGLAAAVQGHCREMRARGLQVQCVAEGVPGGLPYEVALCLFRVVQEALNNVVKHSGAGVAQVSLRGTGDALLLSIVDAGRGFDEAGSASPNGLGLASMRERLRLIGGEVMIKSRPGRGTTVDARVPLPWASHMTVADAPVEANTSMDTRAS